MVIQQIAALLQDVPPSATSTDMNIAELLRYGFNGLVLILMTIGWAYINSVNAKLKEQEKKTTALEKDLALNTQRDDTHEKQFLEIKQLIQDLDKKIERMKS